MVREIVIMKKCIFLQFIFIILPHFSFSQDNVKDITILHWNDFHARNMPYKVSKKDTATGDTIYYYIGGTSNMLGYLKKYRTPNSLVLNAGDDFQGTPISTITRGKSQIELLNLYNLDAFVLGNHEFDYGQYALDSALRLAKFDYLSANVLVTSRHSLMGKPYVIKNIEGVKFGIIGITLPDLFDVSLPKNVSDIVMLDPDSVIKAGISELKRLGSNVIILLTHCGVDYDKEFAQKYFKDVDIIVGGHSHTPLYKPVIVNGVIIVQAGSYSRWLGKLDLKVDVDKDTVIGYYGKLIETVMDSSMYDKAAQEKVEQMIASMSGEMNRVIGKLQTDWNASYSQESNLGQFEADAFREAAGTDIAFINGGGLRKSLYKGDITVSDIWEINPFGNTVVTFSVSVKTLEKMLKYVVAKKIENKLKGASTEILDVSGLTYSYDSKSPDSTLVISINNSPLDENSIYTIAANNYIASQFKKFFGDLPEKIEFKETGYIDRDLIIEAVEKQKIINSGLEKRITDRSIE
jgi:5'-nucleotidase/UDP-sugar diphosphatase